MNAQDQPAHTENVAAFDGTDSPVKGCCAEHHNGAQRIDARTFEAQGKVIGKPTVMTRVAISANCKTPTAAQSGQDAQGQAVKNVIVAGRQ